MSAAPSTRAVCSLMPQSPSKEAEEMSFPFCRRSWDLAEEFPRSTFSHNPGAPSSLLQTPNQVASPASSPQRPSACAAARRARILGRALAGIGLGQ